MKFLLFILLASPAVADTVYQSAVHEAKWQTEESPLSCTLRHEVTDFGETVFHRENGEPLQLSISTTDHPASQETAELIITNTPWQFDEFSQKLITLPVTYGQREFRVEGNAARKALAALQQGQFVQLQYASQSSIQPVSVILSNVQFLPAMREFQECSDKMHPDSFNDLQQFNVYFESEKAILDNSASQRMKRLAEYLKVDDSISRIIIESHTDSFGRRELNTELSDKRAQVVKTFLIEQAEIDEAIIESHSYRDNKPIASNKTPDGRAKNRRTELRLIR